MLILYVCEVDSYFCSAKQVLVWYSANRMLVTLWGKSFFSTLHEADAYFLCQQRTLISFLVPQGNLVITLPGESLLSCSGRRMLISYNTQGICLSFMLCGNGSLLNPWNGSLSIIPQKVDAYFLCTRNGSPIMTFREVDTFSHYHEADPYLLSWSLE